MFVEVDLRDGAPALEPLKERRRHEEPTGLLLQKEAEDSEQAPLPPQVEVRSENLEIEHRDRSAALHHFFKAAGVAGHGEAVHQGPLGPRDADLDAEPLASLDAVVRSLPVPERLRWEESPDTAIGKPKILPALGSEVIDVAIPAVGEAEELERAVVRFADNLKAKIKRPAFRGDIVPLLAPGTAYDPDVAYERVVRGFIDRWARRCLSGWQGLCYGEGSGVEDCSPMETARVRSLAREILALPEPERQQLAREVLPALLSTRAGLEEIDAALRDLSDDELRALVERARQRASDLSEDEVAAIIAEGLRAARAQGRP